MDTLNEIDNRYNTHLATEFNGSPFSEFLTYVEGIVDADYATFQLVKAQFDGFVNSTNNTLIETPLIIEFMRVDTINKLSALVEFIGQHLRANPDIGGNEQIGKRAIAIASKYQNYIMYYKSNYKDLIRYVSYQNYIRQGKDFVRFQEYKG